MKIRLYIKEVDVDMESLSLADKRNLLGTGEIPVSAGRSVNAEKTVSTEKPLPVAEKKPPPQKKPAVTPVPDSGIR